MYKMNIEPIIEVIKIRNCFTNIFIINLTVVYYFCIKNVTEFKK